MLLGRVIGAVVPCVVCEGLDGTPMLLVQPLQRDAAGGFLVNFPRSSGGITRVLRMGTCLNLQRKS